MARFRLANTTTPVNIQKGDYYMQRFSIQIALLGVATFVSVGSQATAYAGSSEQPMTTQKTSIVSTVFPKAWLTPVTAPALRSLSLLAFVATDSCFDDKAEDAAEKAAKKAAQQQCQTNKQTAQNSCAGQVGSARATCEKTANDNFKACMDKIKADDKIEDQQEKLSKKCK